jgi:transposase
VEPNSGLGLAFGICSSTGSGSRCSSGSREPLWTTTCERALKKAILDRKNTLFRKTENGARVGDLFMSLIHTCELCGANPFDYLTRLQRHAAELEQSPSPWMPWNYRATLPRSGVRVDSG